MSIKKALNHLAPEERCAKLSTGLTDPIAGPILPRLEAAAPRAEVKSKPKKVNTTEEIVKINM